MGPSVASKIIDHQCNPKNLTWKKFVMISNTKKQREMIADITTLWIN